MTLQNTAEDADMPRHITGIEELAPLFDGVIIDLWGCVHDGVRAFPAALEAMAELRRAKRKIWLLSNSPRRAEVVAGMMADSMGVFRDSYDGIMTSGEAVWHALKEKHIAEWGARCLHIGTKTDMGLYDGLGLSFAGTAENSDMIVCTGMDDGVTDPAHYAETLRRAAALDVPMVCANPDRIVHVGESLIICPGTLTDMYAALDGKVVYFGKPYHGVYGAVLERMGADKVLAVGDGMPTDIAGATAAGLSSVLLTTGIHRDDMPQTAGDEEGLTAFLRSWPARPDYLLDGLRW